MKKLFISFMFMCLSVNFALAETYEFEETFKKQVEAQKKADEEIEKERKEQEKRDREYQKEQAKYHNRQERAGLMLGLGSGFISSQYKGVDLDKQTPFSLQVAYQGYVPLSNTSIWDIGSSLAYEGFYGSAKGDRSVKSQWHFWGINILADMNFDRHDGGFGLGFVAGLGYGFLRSYVDETVYEKPYSWSSKPEWITYERENTASGWYYNLGISLNLGLSKLIFSYKIPSFQAQDWQTNSVMSAHIQFFYY